ncbi:MAG: hypothetical protein QW835_03465 [Candidatus Hadarchaeum sp.]
MLRAGDGRHQLLLKDPVQLVLCGRYGVVLVLREGEVPEVAYGFVPALRQQRFTVRLLGEDLAQLGEGGHNPRCFLEQRDGVVDDGIETRAPELGVVLLQGVHEGALHDGGQLTLLDLEEVVPDDAAKVPRGQGVYVDDIVPPFPRDMGEYQLGEIAVGIEDKDRVPPVDVLQYLGEEENGLSAPRQPRHQDVVEVADRDVLRAVAGLDPDQVLGISAAAGMGAADHCDHLFPDLLEVLLRLPLGPWGQVLTLRPRCPRSASQKPSPRRAC